MNHISCLKGIPRDSGSTRNALEEIEEIAHKATQTFGNPIPIEITREILASVVPDRTSRERGLLLQHLLVFGYDFERELDFSRVDLAGIDLVRPDSDGFEWLNLGKIDLSKSNLTGANLSTHQFSGSLRGSRLLFAVMASAGFNKVDFSGSDMRGFYAMGSGFDDAKFSKANLRYASIFLSVLEDAIFTQADLGNADFSGNRIRRGKFTGANLENTRFSSELSGSDFVGALNIEKADFTGSWAWRDNPPTGIPDMVNRVALCPRPEEEYASLNKPDNCTF